MFQRSEGLGALLGITLPDVTRKLTHMLNTQGGPKPGLFFESFNHA